MAGDILYIKLNRSYRASENLVKLSDIASVYCANESTMARANSMKIHIFGDKKPLKVKVNVIDIIRELSAEIQGLTIESIGETDTVMEYEPRMPRGIFPFIRTFFVILIAFFGTAFTIMAFHNDIGISNLFYRILGMCTGDEKMNRMILEVTYSIGLAIGIIVFYNHIGKKRLSKDLTPIEVEMKVYRKDADYAYVDMCDEGKIKDGETLK